MRRRNKFLILTAGYGDGHIKVAQALQQTIEQYGDQHVIIDLYQEALPKWNGFCKQLYKKSAAMAGYGLDYYGWSYYLTRNMSSDNKLFKWIRGFIVKTLANIIEREMPTALINTFPYGNMIDCLQDRGIELPTFTVITDYTLHSRWLHGGPDHYYIASAELQRTLEQRGIPKERTTVSGIPIRKQFDRLHDMPHTKHARSVLIMSGSYLTVSRTVKLVNELLKQPDIEIDIVCGRDERLKQWLTYRYRDVATVRIFGFIDNIHELMIRSFCMITKAGGVTLSEAVHLQIPILIYNPLPGQEKENASYLAGKEVVLVSRTIHQLSGQIRELLRSDDKAELMRRRAGSLRMPDAADAIVRHMRHTLEGSVRRTPAADIHTVP
ncbi:galactosyldiacylglycerol synthase [Paenibacillus mesophilus]|uniref:MGDG synthase family glycosyltransferase n=1 Tax=Paenibacillus mesophilus TaxID=2582849 RepID=UPI00110E48A9|nr:glycosyltransferase [Paenibacillus mesophilus]TMV52331.1 galactosyldiacylglycerol synthase [Paenibacillus mesophilus]